MLRTASLALLLASPAALAQEYASEQQQVAFDGVGNVIDATYTVPLGFQIDILITEIWIGVTLELQGDSEFGLHVEGLSDLDWTSGDDLPIVRHDLEPVDGSGLAAQRSNVGFDVVFQVDEVNSNGGRSNLFTVPLFTQDFFFELNGTPFTPFLLPDNDPATPSSETIRTRSNDLAFTLPLGIPIGLGQFASLEAGAILSGWPVASSTFAGDELVTLFEDKLITGDLELEEQLPEAKLKSQYAAVVYADIGYVIDLDLYVKLNILGLFEPTIQVPVYRQTFNLFQTGDINDMETWKDIGFNSAEYFHPLPMMDVPLDVIDFGTVDVGEVVEIQVPLNNDGYLELEGIAGLTGDFEFSVSPAEFFADFDGGQATVVLSFAPEQEGEYLGQLVIESSDPYLEYMVLDVMGKAVTPVEEDPDRPGDNGVVTNPGQGSDLYSTCGCASPGAPSGFLPLVGLVPLAFLRRRRG